MLLVGVQLLPLGAKASILPASTWATATDALTGMPECCHLCVLCDKTHHQTARTGRPM